MRDSREERSFFEDDRWCRWLCSLRPEEGEDLWRDVVRWLAEEPFLLPCRCDGERLRDREEALRLRLCELCRLEEELSLDSRRLSSSLEVLMGELRADPASL